MRGGERNGGEERALSARGRADREETLRAFALNTLLPFLLAYLPTYLPSFG